MKIRLVNPLEALFIFLDKAKEMPIVGAPLVRASAGSDASHAEALGKWLTEHKSYATGLSSSKRDEYGRKVQEYIQLTGGGQ